MHQQRSSLLLHSRQKHQIKPKDVHQVVFRRGDDGWAVDFGGGFVLLLQKEITDGPLHLPLPLLLNEHLPLDMCGMCGMYVVCVVV